MAAGVLRHWGLLLVLPSPRAHACLCTLDNIPTQDAHGRRACGELDGTHLSYDHRCFGEKACAGIWLTWQHAVCRPS
jgi:hypothetical protein